MSTSDAGDREQRAEEGETATTQRRTPRAARTSTFRSQQDESFGERFQQENPSGDERPDQDRDCQGSGVRQDGPHTNLRSGANRVRQDEAAPCACSQVQLQKPSGLRFTSSLFFILSKSLRIDTAEVKLKLKLDSGPHSVTGPQRAETEVGCCQVNRRTSPLSETTSVCLLPETTAPVNREEEVITVVFNESETSRDLSANHSLSNGDFGPHEHNGLQVLPCGAQPKRTGSGSVEEGIKNHTKLENQEDLEELSSPAVTMLSSTVVTVLAPHWSGRLRRTKRFEGSGTSDVQGNLQGVTNTAANSAHFQETQNQQGVERVLTDGLQATLRVPFLGTRRNTVGWSTVSGPARLDCESKRKMNQTVSLDVNSGRMDNRKLDAGVLSPVSTTASPLSPLSLDPDEQRRSPQTGHQGTLSALSSKPTTSSLLLSLRRNNNGRSSIAASTFSEENPLASDREGNLFTTHLPQTFLNNNEQKRSKSLFSPSSMSCRTTEPRPVLSPSNHRERNISESRFFPTSLNKDTEDTPFTQQPQTRSRTQSNFTSSKQALVTRGVSERQQNCCSSDKNTKLIPESSVSSPRHSPYDRTILRKTQSFPRGTTLTSTCWWKQVPLDGSSPLAANDRTNIKDQLNTPLVPPCNDNSNLTSPGSTDNRRFSSQIPNNINTTESVCKGNMNLVMKTQGGTHNLTKQRNPEDSPDHKSDRFVKQEHSSNLNHREPQNILSRSKISRTTAQTALSHPKELSKHDVSNSSFIANVTELPPTLLNPKSSDTPTESSSIYNNNHCSSKTNSTPTSPHNKDSEKFTKWSLSLATTVTLNSQALTSKITSGVPLTTNTKTSSSFLSHPVSSQTSTHTSSQSSSQTARFTNTATPIGFERSYASLAKPVHPKTLSSLIPTISAPSKSNYSPVPTASTTSSTIGSCPAATTVPSTSLLTPATLAITSPPTTLTLSSLLTPPATPVITSPKETSSLKEIRTFSNRSERDPKKLRAEGKRVRRVTWEDSVDLQYSEPITVKRPDPSGVPVSPLSPTRSPRSVRAPSIFSFLRSSSQTTNTSPLCSPTPKTSSIQVGKGGKYRSLSSDSADLTSREREKSKERPSDTMIFDQVRWDLTTPRQESTLSVESGTVQCCSTAPLSLPPDFSSGYKLRYSSPPYSTLMSSRTSQGETKTITHRSPLFPQASQSIYSSHLSLHNEPGAFKPSLSLISSPQTVSLPFQNKTATQESSKCGVSETDQVNNNHSKNSSQDHQILLVDNRVHISSQCLQSDKENNPSSTCVTETLVYSLKSKIDTAAATEKNTTPKPLQHTANTAVSVETKLSQQPHTMQRKKSSGEPHTHLEQSSSGGSSAESQSQDDVSCNRRTKESVLGKSRFFSVESSNDQSPKRSRFALKKSDSTPSSSSSRSDSERAKTNNKMDQVLNRLKQTFSTRRCDDDLLFPWKWKRTSQTPSVSGSSDISSVSEVTADGIKTLEERQQEGHGTQNRYTVIPPSAVGSTTAADQFSMWSDKSTPETDQDEQKACAGPKSESKTQVHLMAHSPTTHHFDFYRDRTDYKPTNQFSSYRDLSPSRSPNPSGGYPTQFRKSASSPRSPFSPFSSLSPLSPFPSPDVTDDSVFYSPKLQRRRESSPCEPGEGMSLGASRRSRASTGPPSAGPGPDKQRLASSYADLKYGIEPGRSFSVSSVLSSRPSGPGRISTGSRFMSVGDLSESSLNCESMGTDQGFFPPVWTTEYDGQPPSDCSGSNFTSDPGKMRSRSLPRSLTRCLGNWSSGVSNSQPASKPAHLWSPNMNTCHFVWNAEGPPTPPPTPPLSPVSRRMSKPPSLSSPTFPSSPGEPQSVDSQSSRGHWPSRGYISSLSTFEESSDSSSDTTTDDEYYLETGEGEQKETEL